MSFIRMVMGQRVRECVLEWELHKDHCTLIDVPQVCIGMVTGKQGAAIRMWQEEWQTIIFFVELKDGVGPEGGNSNSNSSSGGGGGGGGVGGGGGGGGGGGTSGATRDKHARISGHATTKLAIFGARRGRRGSELSVMQAIEKKLPGTFVRSTRLNIIQ
jgi:hypothetical protein